MPNFISKAACHGRRPSNLMGVRYFQRPELIARMLKERTVARFIVAPSGYGKTSLVLEYVETMFDFVHTFWINAQSPCFIRDLDARRIAASCLKNDAEVGMVVIEDLPALDAERSRRLSDELDVLMRRGCEVVVTCAPSCDAPASLQPDSIRLGSRDMLLSDEELDVGRTSDERARRPSASVPAYERIACLAWSAERDSSVEFVAELLREECPLDMLLATLSILVLKRGTYGDLLAIGPLGREFAAQLATDYPHLGLNDETETFEAAAFDLDDIWRAAKSRIDMLVRRSKLESRMDLAYTWADMLLKAGVVDRACDVIRTACPRNNRSAWVVEHAQDIVSRGSFYSGLRLIETLYEQRHEERLVVCAVEMLCRRVLGDEEEACLIAKRYAFDDTVPTDLRIVMLVVLARYALGNLRHQANAELIMLAALESGELARQSKAVQLAQGWCSCTDGAEHLAQYWRKLRDAGAQDDVLCLLASWAFGAVTRRTESGVASEATQHLANMDAVERYVRDRLTGPGGGPLDFFTASAGLSMEQAHAQGMPYAFGALPTRVVLDLRRAEMDVLSQRRRFEQAETQRQAKQDDWIATHPDAYLSSTDLVSAHGATLSVPTLSVRLFGKFEVMLGDEPIDDRFMKRHSMRMMFVLLVINQGRELSRDYLMRVLWPEKDASTAKRSYYGAWGNLRRALSLPDGTCPYLIRHQMGCSLATRYVKSDVSRLDEICRELLFGRSDIREWSEIYAEIDRDYACELLPAEHGNELVNQVRNEYKAKLVDALVQATFNVISGGNPQWGIWFARAALGHDETREDAYVALMRAQIACGQRTAAMMTFLRCRRYLSVELGVDPSQETTALYEDLLNGDEAESA